MAPSAEQFAALDEIAARYGATRAQVALAWLLGHSPVTLAIPGTSSLAHLEENMAATRLSLSGEDIAALDKLAYASWPLGQDRPSGHGGTMVHSSRSHK